MLKMAMVGMGRWGERLIESVQGKSRKVSFVAGASRDPGRHASVAERFRIYVADLDTVLADDNVDAVLIATPHSEHHAGVLAAAAAGKHILVEKPFTLTRADAESAIAACRAAGVKLGHGLNRRFLPAFSELSRRLARGDIGQLIHVEGLASWPSGLSLKPDVWRASRSECPAGAMTPRGIHALDCLIHLAGPVVSVFAHSDRRAVPVDVDDATSALLKFESGVTGYLSSHYATAEIWRLQLYGTKGWLEMNGEEEIIFRAIGGEREYARFPAVPLDRERAELEAFADHLAGIADFPVADAEVVNAISVLEAITSSAQASRPVTIVP